MSNGISQLRYLEAHIVVSCEELKCVQILTICPYDCATVLKLLKVSYLVKSYILQYFLDNFLQDEQ